MSGGILELDGAIDRIAQVDLSLNHVDPGRRAGILEVGHEGFDRRIEGIDDHLAIDRPGDLHSAILQIARHGTDTPLRRANTDSR